MGRQFIDASMLWESTSNDTIWSMGRIVVELQHDIFGPNLEDVSSINLLNPDGELVLTIAPPASSLSTNCATYGYNATNAEWLEFMWPTPGSPEPDATMMASLDDIKFSSIMGWRFFDLNGTGIL